MPRKIDSNAVARARELFASGLSLPEVSKASGVPVSTLQRWRRQDNIDWEALRQQRQQHDWRHIVSILDAEIAGIAADSKLSPASKADTLLKLTQVADNLRRRNELMPDEFLSFAENFVQWAVKNLTVEERETLANWIRAWSDGLIANWKKAP